jgi:hypothetical protein
MLKERKEILYSEKPKRTCVHSFIRSFIHILTHQTCTEHPLWPGPEDEG